MALPRSSLRVAALLAVLASSWVAGGCLWEEDDSDQDGKRVVVSIGDSVAAGQGNPPYGRFLGPRWKCYRSDSSGHVLAARRVARSDPELGFISFACSGAEMLEGLVGKYKPKKRLPAERPQLERLAERAELSDVEAVLLSVGGNDVGFSDIVKFCAVEESCEESTKFNPPSDWKELEPGVPPTLRNIVGNRIEELAGLYAQVAEGIPPEISSDDVLVTEYFDATRYPGIEQCAIFRKQVLKLIKDDLVTKDESTWAHDHVLLPLNREIAEAAVDHGWTLVDDVDESFADHGICAPRGERWIRTFGESWDLQNDHLGTLHPNELGHVAIGDLIAEDLADQLDLELAD